MKKLINHYLELYMSKKERKNWNVLGRWIMTRCKITNLIAMVIGKDKAFFRHYGTAFSISSLLLSLSHSRFSPCIFLHDLEGAELESCLTRILLLDPSFAGGSTKSDIEDGGNRSVMADLGGDGFVGNERSVGVH